MEPGPSSATKYTAELKINHFLFLGKSFLIYKPEQHVLHHFLVLFQVEQIVILQIPFYSIIGEDSSVT